MADGVIETAAGEALLAAALAEVSARRAAPPAATGPCGVCPNGRADRDRPCDPAGGREPPAALLRRLERCERRLAARLAIDAADPMACNPRLSLESLHWRCERALRCAEKLPPETLGRWVGFVEGCLEMRGMIGPGDGG